MTLELTKIIRPVAPRRKTADRTYALTKPRVGKLWHSRGFALI